MKIADRVCLDTGIFELHFLDDRRVREIIRRIETGSLEGHTGELNLAELYYKTCEKLGSEVADIRNLAIRKSAIRIHPASRELTPQAASIKCKYRSQISLADAYTMATSMMNKCRLATTDPLLKEIDAIPTIFFDVSE